MEPSQATPAVLLPGVAGLATFLMLFIQCIELLRDRMELEEFIEGEFTDAQCVEFIVEGFIVDIDDRLTLRGGGTEIPQVELWKHYDEKRRAFTRLRNRYEQFRGHPNYRSIYKGLERRRRIRNSDWFSAIDKQEAGNVDPMKYDDYMLQLRDAAEDSIGSVATGAGIGYGVKRFKAYIAGGPGKKPVEFDMGWMPDAPPPSASNYPTGDPENNNNNSDMESLQLRKTGKTVLDRRMAIQKMYTTMCYYNMSIVKNTNRQSATDPWIHKLEIGSGPALYTTYDYGKTDVSGNRNPNFNSPKEPDSDFNDPSTSMYNVGVNTTCYVFAADWPWLTMNHDERTQPAVAATDKEYRQLQWNYQATTTGLNDPNIPLTMTDFITNPDWKYIKVYGIEYTFDFTNTFPSTMCCEILLFKFKADPDAMDYSMQVKAPFSRQKQGFKDYVVYPSSAFEAQDIIVQARKRLYIPGLDTVILGSSGYWGTKSSFKGNTKRYTMAITRQYVITRPVLETTDGELPEIDENEFFNTYYEPHKGIYMRIQAWPQSSTFTMQTQSSPGTITEYSDLENRMKPTAADAGTTISPGLECRMFKKAKYKFDAERISKLVN